jgi:hypothetical protein
VLLDSARVQGVIPPFRDDLVDYISIAMRSINHDPVDYIRYSCAIPAWNNPKRRREGAIALINGSPKAYGQWLRFLVRQALHRRDQQDPFVFIRGEEPYLELEGHFGRGCLDVTYKALCEGIIDHVRGRTAERERVFTAAVSELYAQE